MANTLPLAPAGRASVRGLILAPARAEVTFSAPRVTIGGVALYAQHFEWAVIPGPAPYRNTFQFLEGDVARVLALTNPTTLSVRVSGAVNGKPETLDLTINDVWIQQARKVDAFHWLVEFADLRCRWEGQRFTFTANRAARVNAFGDGIVSLDPSDPASVRAQFDRFERFRYEPWSVNRDDVLRAINGEGFAFGPWTALQLLRIVLGEVYVGAGLSVSVADNGVVVEGMEWIEEPVQQVITELASLARVRIAVTLAGEVHVYGADTELTPSAVMPTTRPPIAGGVLYFTDQSRIRPESATVRFAKRREVRILATDPPSNLTEYRPTQPLLQRSGTPWKTIGAYNVAKLPRDITHNGRLYQRETWVPMTLFLEMVGVADEVVRKMWFSDLLATHLAVTRAGRALNAPDPIKLMEALAIKASYRQHYRIDPYWVSRWDDWDTRRCTVIDGYTQFTATSPVWCDFLLRPNLYANEHMQGRWKFRAFNYPLAEHNPNRTSSKSVATLKIVDKAAGVVGIDFPRDADAAIDDFLPGCFDNLPTISVGASGEAYYWQDGQKPTTMRESFELEAIISTTPAVDDDHDMPNDSRFHSLSTKPEGGKGPPWEWFYSGEVARVPYPQGLDVEGTVDADALRAAMAGEPVNGKILEAIAQGQIATMSQSWRDRWAGYVEYPGCDVTKLRPFSAVHGITIRFDNRRGLTTTYDLTEPPPEPQLISLLTPDMRRAVYRQLRPGD